MKLGIIGGGRVAWAFASSWRRAAAPLSGIALRAGSKSRVPELASAPLMSIGQLLGSSEVVLAAVSDSALPLLANELRSIARIPLFHTSGALPAAILGCPGGFSLHPLRSLPPAGTEVSLESTLLVFEGDESSRAVAEEIASTLGARIASIEAGEKLRYHAAAVFASNYIATLLETALTLIEHAGVEGVTKADLADLAESSIANWRAHDGNARFTGPIVRGDAGLVESELAALGDEPEATLYRELAARLASIVLRHAPERLDVARIRRLLEDNEA
jgi:predicted short-subunit dehydrogenase-like oxidoreductase (DUF2520 family)